MTIRRKFTIAALALIAGAGVLGPARAQTGDEAEITRLEDAWRKARIDGDGGSTLTDP